MKQRGGDKPRTGEGRPPKPGHRMTGAVASGSCNRQAAPPPSLFGRPVVEVDDMPDPGEIQIGPAVERVSLKIEAVPGDPVTFRAFLPPGFRWVGGSAFIRRIDR